MKIFAPVSLALAGALAIAAAAPPTLAQPRTPRACFWIRNVSNFAAVDNNRVFIRVGANRIFQLTLFGNCFNLSWARNIALRSRSSSNVCEGPNPALEIFNRSFATGRERCPVTDVRLLTPEEVAALPRGARP